MLPATALAPLITGCAQQTFTVQNKPAAVAPVKTITHHFFVSELGRRKPSMAKICGGAENVVKTETRRIRKWIARFYYFRHLYRWKRVCIAHTPYEPLHRYGQLYLHCSLIYLGSFQLFLHSDQPLSEGEIIPFSGVCQSGRSHYPRRRRGGFTH